MGLDYVLVPTRIARSIRSATVLHRSRLVRPDHRTVVMIFKLRIRSFRRIPSPFHLFDFSRLVDPNVREQFELALTQRLSAAPPDNLFIRSQMIVFTDISGFSLFHLRDCPESPLCRLAFEASGSQLPASLDESCEEIEFRSSCTNQKKSRFRHSTCWRKSSKEQLN